MSAFTYAVSAHYTRVLLIQVSWLEFEEAAEGFMGEIEFFAVVTSHWTEDEFENWVEQHREPVMQKLSLQDYFNVWGDSEEDEKTVLAFRHEETREGRAMFKLLKKLADENSKHADTLEIVLIDPDEFPLMVDVWEETFDIEIKEGPQIDLFDIFEKEGIWFDMSPLYLEAD